MTNKNSDPHARIRTPATCARISNNRKPDSDVIDECPIEYVEDEKGDGKGDARTSIDPIGNLLRCHCGPAGLRVDRVFRSIIMVDLQCGRAGRWLHIHANIVAILLNQIVHALGGGDGWYILFARETLTTQTINAINELRANVECADVCDIHNAVNANTWRILTWTERKLLKPVLPVFELPFSMLEHERDFWRPALISLRAGFGVSVDFRIYRLFTYGCDRRKCA